MPQDLQLWLTPENYWVLVYMGNDQPIIDKLLACDESQVTDPVIAAAAPIATRTRAGVSIELSNFAETSRNAAKAIGAGVGLDVLFSDD